jgi:hypothetical protein
MTMTEQLTALRDQVSAKLPADVLEIVHRATQDLENSGLANRSKGVGDAAPAFKLPNASGQLVSSAKLLARGPLVLTVYRGNW